MTLIALLFTNRQSQYMDNRVQSRRRIVSLTNIVFSVLTFFTKNAKLGVLYNRLNKTILNHSQT